MGYYRINTLTNCAKKYGSFLNDYEPYQEIRDFRNIGEKFSSFSNTPIIFERDKSYKNDDEMCFASPNQELYDSNYRLLSVNGIYKFNKE